MPGPSRSDAEALDAADALASFRDQFVLDDDGGTIYLNGNSLGRLPLNTRERIATTVAHEWGQGLSGSWEHWLDLPAQVGDALGTHVLGAGPGQVIVSDSTTVNLYKVVHAALGLLNRHTVLAVDADDFPTDRYVVEGIAQDTGLILCPIHSDPVTGPTADDVRRATEGEPAVVVMSHVHFRSGALADMSAITEVVHTDGGAVVWDLSHAAGVVPADLDESGVALAVGCTYKYLNAGPGAPAWLYVRRDLQEGMRQPIWGWFGQREQFVMGPRYDPEPDHRRFLTGTPSPVLLAAVDEGARLTGAAGIDALRAKSRALTALAVELADASGLEVATPRVPDRRGAHVSLRHPDAEAVTAALIERVGVVPDFRPPDCVRFGFPPLYTRFVDVWDAFDRWRGLSGGG